MKDWFIEHKMYIIAAVILVIGGGYYLIGNDNEKALTIASSAENKLQSESGGLEKNQQEQEVKEQKPDVMMVDVKGQIKLPGVYQAAEGERVIDVIGRAGGLTEKADQSQVNFAEHVQDEMVIYIPSKGEEGQAAPTSTGGTGTSGSTSTNQQGKINLNKADASQLQNLPGIGPAKAAAIIEYRETSGAFKTVEDLKNISGIGDKTFEKLKDLVDIK